MSVSSNCEFRTVRVGHGNFCIDRRYSSMKVIGTGSYGVVVSAIDKQTGRKVAIKKVKDVFCDTNEAKRILRELKLLHHFVQHENVVQLLDIMSYPPKAEKIEDIYIVTNFMDRDLGRIIDSKQVFSDQHLQYFLYQILRGLKYIHSANVLHRDLKPSNIVVNLNCDLALCDFGLARGFDAEVKHLTEYVVTRFYRPPELLLECATYGKPVDVWSVGCIFAELILRKVLFCGETPQHQLRLIVDKIGMPSSEKLAFVDSREALRELHSITTSIAPPFKSLFPPNTNSDALDLLQQMLQFAPDDRISVENALSHVYLKDFHGHMSEPACAKLFDFGFEKANTSGGNDLSDAQVRRMMYEEMCKFRPEHNTNTTNSSNSTTSTSDTASSNSVHNDSAHSITSVSSVTGNASVSLADATTTFANTTVTPTTDSINSTVNHNIDNSSNIASSTSSDTTVINSTTGVSTTATPSTHTTHSTHIGDLRLACSTEQSCDDESVRTIELFGRSVSSSLCSADCADSVDTRSVQSTHSMHSAYSSSSHIHSVFSVSQDSYPCVGIASMATLSTDSTDSHTVNNTNNNSVVPDVSMLTHSTSNHLQSVFSMSTDPYPSVGIAHMVERRQSESHPPPHHALPPAGHRHTFSP